MERKANPPYRGQNSFGFFTGYSLRTDPRKESCIYLKSEHFLEAIFFFSEAKNSYSRMQTCSYRQKFFNHILVHLVECETRKHLTASSLH